jgi:hypothetical protein
MAAARCKDTGAFPVSASRTRSSVAEGEKHHDDAGHDDTNHMVEAHHEFLANEVSLALTAIAAIGAHAVDRCHDRGAVEDALDSEST